jgi:hypothetical protein
LKGVAELLFAAYNVFYGISVKQEFTEVVLKGLSREFFEPARIEIIHLRLLGTMQQYHLGLVLPCSNPSVEGYTVYPTGNVCLRDPSPKHALKVYDEIKCDFVNVICVDNHHIFTPSNILNAVVHISLQRYINLQRLQNK